MDENMLEPQTTTKKPATIYIIVAVLSVLLMATFFMPIMSVTEEYREVLEDAKSIAFFDDLDIEYEELIDVSVFELAKICFTASEFEGDEAVLTVGIIIFVIGGLIFLSALFALLKKSKTSIVFTILSLGAYNFVFGEVMTSFLEDEEIYQKGIAFTAFYILAIALIVANIIFIVKKKADKKTTMASI